jgi:integrase
VLILLGAHAGLRVSEACALEWINVNVDAQQVKVKHGKGAIPRTVSISAHLAQILTALETGRGGLVLDLGEQGARAELRKLCSRAGVTYQAVHSL